MKIGGPVDHTEINRKTARDRSLSTLHGKKLEEECARLMSQLYVLFLSWHSIFSRYCPLFRLPCPFCGDLREVCVTWGWATFCSHKLLFIIIPTVLAFVRGHLHKTPGWTWLSLYKCQHRKYHYVSFAGYEWRFPEGHSSKTRNSWVFHQQERMILFFLSLKIERVCVCVCSIAWVMLC